MYRTKNKISYLFAFLYPSAATSFPFFPLLGETQKGSGNNPKNHSDFARVPPSFIGERGPGGEYKTGYFDHKSTHLKFCPVQNLSY